ncbi:MAG: DNA-directed RNA polymerase sigma-70 factor [Actinomycetota bacterium]|nr:MAG: DNA-directed RNA polymerase sigma-70 factor [Actinomycetota bacterium]
METIGEALEAARRGDPNGLASLYEELRTPVFRYLVAATGDRSAAEDLLADVFVEVARGVRRFVGGPGAFVGWVFAIARHDVADLRRGHRRRAVEPVPDPPEPELAPDHADDVAHRVDLEHREAPRLHAALARLNEEQREVVLMRFVAERSLEEVAAALGTTVGAVKARQHRALARLRRLLEADR